MSKIKFKKESGMDVVAIGRIGIDLNPNEYNCPLERTVSFTRSVGGSPANIAVAVSKYGLKTGFIGKVSDDAFGRYIRGYFNEKNIDTRSLRRDENQNKTGLAFVEIKAPNESDIIMYRSDAVDLKLDMEDIDEGYIKDSKVLVVSGTALAASPSREAVLLAVEWARKNKTKILFDVDYRPYTWNSLKETSLYCSLVAKMSDIIIGTREEFNVIEGIELPENRDERTTANYWLSHSPELVVVKRGKQGATAYLSSGELYEGEVYPVEALKSQGAGDSFAGGFISSLVKGKSVREALSYGAGAAAIVVQKNSCSEAMPTEFEIEAFIKEYKNRGY